MIESLTTPVLLTSAICIALATPLLVWSLTTRSGIARQQTLVNLERGLTPGRGGKQSAPHQEGVSLASLAHRVTPGRLVRPLDRLLSRAGRPSAWPLERVLVTKLLLGTIVASLTMLLAASDPSAKSVAIVPVATAFAWFLPEVLLYNAATKRRTQIQHALPDTLDQLTIAVEAGLGFEAALAHVSHNSSGPLSDEFIRTLQDIQVGQPRRVAYTSLAERAHVTDLRRFIRSIIQGDEHGISISRVLATQAREMRIRRRQMAEEKAMKIPVKVLFPLIFCIMPVLMIVVMGPAVINIIEQFTGRAL